MPWHIAVDRPVDRTPDILAQGIKRHVVRSRHFVDAVPTRLPGAQVPTSAHPDLGGTTADAPQFRLARRPYPKGGNLTRQRRNRSRHRLILTLSDASAFTGNVKGRDARANSVYSFSHS